MNEWVKRLLGITEPVIPDKPTQVERDLDRVSMKTQRVVVRSEAQIARTITMMTSWENLYGRRRRGR